MTQSFLTPNCIVSEIEKEKEKKKGDCLLPEFRIYQISFNIPHF